MKQTGCYSPDAHRRSRARTVGLLEGTCLLTRHGYQPIQTLRRGDELLTMMGRSPLFSPIVWIGSRTLQPDRHARPYLVRIRPDAVADTMPLRDVWLAPEHGIYIEGSFYLPRHLVNNASLVVQEGAHRRVWVVQLSLHDVIVADGLPVETFLGETAHSGFTEAIEPWPDNVTDYARFAGSPRAVAP